jgi:hypothetical protein
MTSDLRKEPGRGIEPLTCSLRRITLKTAVRTPSDLVFCDRCTADIPLCNPLAISAVRGNRAPSRCVHYHRLHYTSSPPGAGVVMEFPFAGKETVVPRADTAAPSRSALASRQIQSRDLTRAARRASRERYARIVRAEHPNLNPAEVARRARHLQQAHMQTISRRGVEVRKRRAS